MTLFDFSFLRRSWCTCKALCSQFFMLCPIGLSLCIWCSFYHQFLPFLICSMPKTTYFRGSHHTSFYCFLGFFHCPFSNLAHLSSRFKSLSGVVIAGLWVTKLEGFFTCILKLETIIEKCSSFVLQLPKIKIAHRHCIFIDIVHVKITVSLRGFLKHLRNPALNIKRQF